ncbi:YigZ family protein [Lysobacteraceae bacterium NML120232]|nr:YigZ family protein [Xanthomonadaceae bacterium NML120232]PJK11040.1 YigZ family protein [Xanthomonadaceae bacterium NML08-0793]
MADPITRYRTIAAPTSGEIKDRGSRFIGYAYPITNTNALREHLDALRDAHPKACHWCYAYRLGADGSQFRANDDGEPSGSAGRPILGQIDSASLRDVLIVVVRYFGGTLLGVPGLIAAYKGAAAAALAAANIIEKEVTQTLWLRCDYPHLSDALRIAKQHQAEVLSQELQLDCQLHLRIPLQHYNDAIQAFQNTRVMQLQEDG